MRLEEILPEIRKGRRAKRACWVGWHGSIGSLAELSLMADDWELEPEPKYEDVHLACNGTAKVRQGDGDVFIDAYQVMLTATDIDTLKVVSDKARGIEKKEPVFDIPDLQDVMDAYNAPCAGHESRLVNVWRGGWDAAIAATKRS